MPDPDKPAVPANVVSILHEIEQLKRRPAAGGGLSPQMALLRAWQSARLARTYADLLAQPRFRPACQFFLDDIYAARDFSQRDQDIQQMYAFMQRVFPASLIRPLKLTVELYDLTRHLDERLLEVLVGPLGVTDSISTHQYAEAYRLCDNYVERARQIEQIYKIGLLLDGIMRMPATGLALKLSSLPARRAGWTELFGFLERGYQAFRQLKGADVFLNTIRQREKTILDRIYAAEAEPFAI
jgi:hypothetical protein